MLLGIRSLTFEIVIHRIKANYNNEFNPELYRETSFGIFFFFALVIYLQR